MYRKLMMVTVACLLSAGIALTSPSPAAGVAQDTNSRSKAGDSGGQTRGQKKNVIESKATRATITDLPTGYYTSIVRNRPNLNGGMTVGGTNDAPTVTYRNLSATNVSWDAGTATLRFTYWGWTFSGTYADGVFSGIADNGQSSVAGTDAWEAESTS